MCISNNRRFRPLQKSSSDCLQFPYFNGRFRKKKVVHIISGRLVSSGCCVPKEEEEEKEENGSVTSTGQQTDTHTQQGGTWQHTDWHKRAGLFFFWKYSCFWNNIRREICFFQKCFCQHPASRLCGQQTASLKCVCALKNWGGGCNLRGFRPYTHLDRIWWGICVREREVCACFLKYVRAH